ncbi:hypothetical protein [Alteromonas halophila]|uniref:Uncharacterized protein n=1 Tax=Alteromonas halophila TaxID=516698 RepID=A0A918MUI8_9ALTE|nr:hypothetical protein [Alteromonas halophila]GGW73436.1 hypothetical protein GCM10007391_01350 [Alteromonas halophila]
MQKLRTEKIQRISSGFAHCAFTDLIACPDRPGHLLCAYRVAHHHMSQDGYIEVALLSSAGTLLHRQRLHLSGWDLRDPQFSIDDRNRLWLTAYAKSFHPDGTVSRSRNISWFSANGDSWSGMHWFGENRWWLWRLVWRNQHAYSLAYQRKARRLDLFVGHPGKAMHRDVQGVLKETHPDNAFPNETELHFDADGTLWALARRDGGNMHAQLGWATPPYRRWSWTELDRYIGGPAWLPFGNSHMLVCGRDFSSNSVSSKLWLLQLTTGKLEVLTTLPSAGDTSYPGLVLDGDTLYISYYSSHIDACARVYLASLTGLTGLRNIVKQREV